LAQTIRLYCKSIIVACFKVKLVMASAFYILLEAKCNYLRLLNEFKQKLFNIKGKLVDRILIF